MYETILIPTDGSEPATQAAERGFELAKQFGSTVHILHIIDVGDTASGDPYGGIGLSIMTDSMISEIEDEAAEIVERLEAQANESGIDTITEIREGAARQDIITYTNENDVDLIVMGTHGRSGVERFLLGSVTERVIRTAGVPVFVIRGEAKENEKT